MFESKDIRLIKMAIRHMWRVANRLDNVDLNNRCLVLACLVQIVIIQCGIIHDQSANNEINSQISSERFTDFDKLNLSMVVRF